MDALIPFSELQELLYNLLTTELSPVSVYDNVPEKVPTSYVTIGEIIATPDNDHSTFRWQVLSTIHVWDRVRGFKSPLATAAQIIALLDHHRELIDIEGWHCVAIRFTQLQTLRDPDPEIRHVPVQFRITIEQES